MKDRQTAFMTERTHCFKLFSIIYFVKVLNCLCSWDTLTDCSATLRQAACLHGRSLAVMTEVESVGPEAVDCRCCPRLLRYGSGVGCASRLVITVMFLLLAPSAAKLLCSICTVIITIIIITTVTIPNVPQHGTSITRTRRVWSILIASGTKMSLKHY